MARPEAPASAASVLVVLAHPDDPEFFCGGTLARWSRQGHPVTYCLLTRGDKGAASKVDPVALARTRAQEQQAAAAVIGARQVIFLDHRDGQLVPDLALRRDIVRVIRQVRPDIVVTCDPANYYPNDRYINHPDHRAAGQATLEAVFPAAGSPMYFPELLDAEGLQPHKVSQVYISLTQAPNLTLDVTEFFDLKVEALRQHASQIPDPEAMVLRLRERMLDPDSPADSPRYVERFRKIELG